MIIGYARVSTKGQAASGNSLEEQEIKLLEKDCSQVFKESSTGIKVDRPVFNKILDQLKSGDTLMVTKLDRLARNVVEGIEVAQSLFNKNVAVHVLNVGLIENTSMGNFFLQTLLAVAELERNMIIERTQEGKAIAKTKPGFKEGRPKKFGQQQIDLALSLLEDNSYTKVVKMTGISKATLVRAKK